MTLKGSMFHRFYPMYDQMLSQFVGAFSWLHHQSVGASLGVHEINDDQWNEIFADAVEAFSWLDSVGHKPAVLVALESVEATSWWWSPEMDRDQHHFLFSDLFQDIFATAEAVDQEEGEDDDDDSVYEFSADKEHLARCLSAS
jgi:hypothetical protein